MPLCLDKTQINCLSSSQDKKEDIKVFLRPRNIFLIESRRGFNSSLGGETIEGGISELANGERGNVKID